MTQGRESMAHPLVGSQLGVHPHMEAGMLLTALMLHYSNHPQREIYLIRSLQLQDVEDNTVLPTTLRPIVSRSEESNEWYKNYKRYSVLIN